MFPGGQLGIYFPKNMDTTYLYPEMSSAYTHTDGTTYDVECFVPGKAAEVPKVECPHPFGASLDILVQITAPALSPSSLPSLK